MKMLAPKGGGTRKRRASEGEIKHPHKNHEGEDGGEDGGGSKKCRQNPFCSAKFRVHSSSPASSSDLILAFLFPLCAVVGLFVALPFIEVVVSIHSLTHSPSPSLLLNFCSPSIVCFYFCTPLPSLRYEFGLRSRLATS